MLSRSMRRAANRRLITSSSVSSSAHRTVAQLTSLFRADGGCEEVTSVQKVPTIRTVSVGPRQRQGYCSAQQLRPYHSSPFLRDDDDDDKGKKEMSAKERKKMLKAKAKAAMAEKEKAKEEAEAAKESAEPASAAEEGKPKDVPSAPTAEEPKKDEAPTPTPAAAAAAAAEESKEAPPPPPMKEEEPCAAAGAAAAGAAAAPPAGGSGYAPPHDEDRVRQYSYDELTRDAARHKAGLDDPTRPAWQNPLHHNDPDHDGSRCYPEDFATREEFEAAVQPLPPVDDGSGRVVAPRHIHELADEMVHLTMLEMSELINKIAEHYNFHEGMLAPGVGAAGGGGDEDEHEEGGGGGGEAQTAFDVKLTGFDAKSKIKIIKECRSIVPGLGLKEAKEMVESAPVAIQKGLSKENAEEIKQKLEALGAEVEIV